MMFILVTVIIAACGYLINDAFDIKSDRINKKDKSIPKIFFLSSYYILFILGCILATYLAFQVNKLHLLSIYFVAHALLYCYSSHFKNLPLVGNIVVAAFSSLVIGILWFAEYESINQILQPQQSYLKALMVAFILFSFIISLVREMIKDAEDIKGDQIVGAQTAALKWGNSSVKKISILLLIFLAILLFISMWQFIPFQINIWITFTLISTLLLLIIGLTYQASTQKHFYRISQLLKLNMFIGVVFLAQLSNYLCKL